MYRVNYTHTSSCVTLAKLFDSVQWGILCNACNPFIRAAHSYTINILNMWTLTQLQLKKLLVCNWLHSVGQNHFYVMMLLNRDLAIQSSSRRFWTVYKPEKSNPLQPSGWHDILSGRPTVQSIIRPDEENFPSRPSSVSRSFKLFQLASVRTTLSVRPAMGFLSKTQIWEDRCNRPDDMDSRPDTLIHKASCAFKIQMSGRQHYWSGRASYIYGNSVHQINRLDDHSLGPDTRSLNMEIVCSWSATVRTRLKLGKNCSEILESRSHSCSSRRLMSTVRTAPRFIKPDAHLSLQPINRGP